MVYVSYSVIFTFSYCEGKISVKFRLSEDKAILFVGNFSKQFLYLLYQRMVAIVAYDFIGVTGVFLFALLGLHSIADSLFIGRVTQYSTLHTYVFWGRYQPYLVYISCHTSLKEYGTFYRYYLLTRLFSPLLEIISHYGVDDAVYLSYSFGVPKHVRSQIGPIKFAVF